MCATAAPNRRLLAKRTDAERSVIREFLSDFQGVLRNWHDSVLDALREQGEDAAAPGRARIMLRDALAPYREAFDAVVVGGWEDGHDAGRGDAIQRHGLDIAFDIQRPEVEDALRENGERASEQIQERMVGDLADALIEAHDRGLGITEDPRTGEPGIVDILQDEVFPDMEGYEAERVARTETISASNKGANVAYEDSDASDKEWLATDDHRTRPTHNRADEQVVAIGDPFTVGGQVAQFPGDPTLTPDERVNCRCSMRPLFN